MANKPQKQPVKKAQGQQQAVKMAKKQQDDNQKLRLALVLTGILTLIAFWAAFNNEFVNWDDSGYMVDNRMITGLNFPHLKRIFSEFVEGNYHPLTMLSLAVDYHFSKFLPDGKLSPAVFHIMNVMFHVANALLVVLFVNKLTKNIIIAGVTGILFGIHPMHVESVAWASERKDVLYTFFYLLSLHCYTRFAMGDGKINKNYLLAIGLFILSCLSKGQAVSLSLVLLLIDYYLGRDFNKKHLLEKAPFFIISAGFGILAIVAQQHTNAIQDNKVFSLFERVQFASYGMVAYLFKLFIPIKLSNFYPYPIKVIGTPVPVDYYVYPVIVLLILFGVYRAFKSGRHKALVFGFGFFLASIIMVLQLMAVGSTIMSDRYAYIPYIGIFFIVGFYYDKLQKEWPGYKSILTGVMSIYMLVMLISTINRCDVWQSSFNLWTDCISKYKTVPVAYNNLGLVYKEGQKYDLALQNYNEAAKVDPSYQATYENRGNIYFLTNKYDLAISDLRTAIHLKPASEVAYNSLGAVFFNMARYDTALVLFNKAIECKKEYPEAYRNRGNVYSVQGRFQPAIEDYNTYLTFDSRFSLAYYWRGLAEFNLKQYDKALADYTQALTLQPKNAEFMMNRSQTYNIVGNYSAALQDAMSAKAMGAKVEDSYIAGLQAKSGGH